MKNMTMKILTRSKRALLTTNDNQLTIEDLFAKKKKKRKKTIIEKKKKVVVLDKKKKSISVVTNLRLKKKTPKWQMGIIVKPKVNKPAKARANGRTRANRRVVLTRSVARRLSADGQLAIDRDQCLVMRHELKKSRILNDDVLKRVFDFLSLKDRFRVQRTCKQFYSVVREMLAEQRVLRIGNVADWYGQCTAGQHSSLNADIEDAIAKKFFSFDKYFYVNDLTQSRHALSTILWKCSHVRCLELHNFNVDVDTIKWITWHAPHLQCLRVDAMKYDLTSRKWSQIGQLLGGQLRHLSVDGHQVRNDLTNLIQHLPLLTQLRLSKYDLPLTLLLKRLSPHLTVLSLTECPHLTVEAVQVMARSQWSATLKRLEVQVSGQCSELDNSELFRLVCHHFRQLQALHFLSHLCPSSLKEVTSLPKLEEVELRFSRDCYLDLGQLHNDQLTNLRSLTVHGAFFMPRMLQHIGQQMPALESLCLTNWAFVCQCPDGPGVQVLDDCPECDQQCLQSLLELTKLKTLFLEFLYSSDYIKPLILSLLTYDQLSKVTLVWYPLNTSINTINFVNDVVTHGARLASRRSRDWIRLRFEKNVIALIDAAKRLPKNLVVEAID